MPIHGCERSFAELANTVLPICMEGMREALEAPTSLAEFAIKGVGPVTLRTHWGLDHDPKGCYVLIEDGRPVYVGISQHVIERLREHVLGADHYAATLAYRIASTRHPHGTTASLAMKDAAFLAQFEESRDYLQALQVAFIEIENPLELYLFEAYCARELETGSDNGGWNTFATH